MYRLTADALGVGDALDQGGALHAQRGTALGVFGLTGGGDLSLDAALFEQQEVELHRIGRGGLVVGGDDQFGDQAGELGVLAGQVGGGVLEVLAQPDRRPSPEELAATVGTFSLRPLLDQDTNAPMLVVNGADDVHVPQHDSLVFQGRRNTEVHLIPDTGHCATSKLPEAVGLMFSWLRRTLENLDVKANS